MPHIRAASALARRALKLAERTLISSGGGDDRFKEALVAFDDDRGTVAREDRSTARFSERYATLWIFGEALNRLRKRSRRLRGHGDPAACLFNELRGVTPWFCGGNHWTPCGHDAEDLARHARAREAAAERGETNVGGSEELWEHLPGLCALHRDPLLISESSLKLRE